MKQLEGTNKVFIDEVHIKVCSGSGGAGCVSYRREKFLPKGGPDGGDGGRGGDMIFKTNPHLKSLFDLTKKKHYKAEDGQSGGGQRKTGKNGKDLVIEVPVGTLLKDTDGYILHDLCSPTSQVCLLKGGKGGKGNHFFKNSQNQTPFTAQTGQKSQEMSLCLELKLIADLGLIGFPNAGKSSLLSRISAAKPKIADYHFTTLSPHIGVINLDALQPQINEPLTVADIPGLVVNAHKGVGLGHKFLKHVERSKALIYVLDALSETNPIDDYKALQKEIACYQKGKQFFLDSSDLDLLKRPFLVVLNKIDALPNQKLKDILLEFKEEHISVIPVSAKEGLGLQSLLHQMQNTVQQKEFCNVMTFKQEAQAIDL